MVSVDSAVERGEVTVSMGSMGECSALTISSEAVGAVVAARGSLEEKRREVVLKRRGLFVVESARGEKSGQRLCSNTLMSLFPPSPLPSNERTPAAETRQQHACKVAPQLVEDWCRHSLQIPIAF